MGSVLVSSQGQRKGGGCCCGRRRSRRVVGEVQGGSRGPVGLGAWGAAPAAAVTVEVETVIGRKGPGMAA